MKSVGVKLYADIVKLKSGRSVDTLRTFTMASLECVDKQKSRKSQKQTPPTTTSQFSTCAKHWTVFITFLVTFSTINDSMIICLPVGLSHKIGP